jgi:hypothetical protein
VVEDPVGLAPIAVFGFNRPEHLSRCIDSLRHNPEASRSSVTFFLDGPRTADDAELVERTRRVALQADFFAEKRIVERDSNWGLARNVIDGVTWIVEEHANVIVVEDDLVVSPAFLCYMNQALTRYQGSPSVFSVSGYNYPRRIMPVPPLYPYDAYFVSRHMCWGWGTWKDRWYKTDWAVSDYEALRASESWRRSFVQVGVDLPRMLDDCMHGTVNSWAVRWTHAHFINHAVCLVPVHSYVNNTGVDGTGTHMAQSDRYMHSGLNCRETLAYPPHVYVDPLIARAFMRTERRSLPSRVMRKAQKVLHVDGQLFARRRSEFKVGAGRCRDA